MVSVRNLFHRAFGRTQHPGDGGFGQNHSEQEKEQHDGDPVPGRAEHHQRHPENQRRHPAAVQRLPIGVEGAEKIRDGARLRPAGEENLECRRNQQQHHRRQRRADRQVVADPVKGGHHRYVDQDRPDEERGPSKDAQQDVVRRKPPLAPLDEGKEEKEQPDGTQQNGEDLVLRGNLSLGPPFGFFSCAFCSQP